MLKNNKLFIYLFIYFICSQISFAATTLFDPNRGESAAPPKAKPVQKKVLFINYQLVGLSFLSSTYYATFQESRNKKIKKIKWREADADKGDSLIAGFHIKAIDNRRVIFQANEEKQYSCKENQANKITCLTDKKEMIFDLVTNKPTQSAKRLLNRKKINKAKISKKRNLKNKQPNKKISSKNPFIMH